MDNKIELPKRDVFFGALIIFICVISYFDFLKYGYFLSDDYELLLVSKNLNVTQLFTADFYRHFPWAFIRPVGLVLWKINYLLYGFSPTGYYLTNLLLHISCSIVTAILVYNLSKNKIAGLISGILFAVHPSHPDAVSFLSGRYDILSALFFMLGFMFYHLSINEQKKNLYYLLSVFSFVVAVYSKEMSVTLPVLLIFYEVFYRGKDNQRSIRSRMYHLLPYFLILAITIGIRFYVFGSIGGYKGSTGDSLHTSMPGLNFIIANFISYMNPLFFGINSAYPKDFSVYFYVILAAIVLGAMVSFKSTNKRLILFLVGTILITFLPLINFSPVYPDLLGARFMYLPSAFFTGVIGLIFAFAWEEKRLVLRAIATSSATAIFVCYFLLLGYNNEAWIAASDVTYKMQKDFIALYPEIPADSEITVYDAPAKIIGSPVFFDNPNAYKISLFFANGCPDVNYAVKFRAVYGKENIPTVHGVDKQFNRQIDLYYDKYKQRIELIRDSSKT